MATLALAGCAPSPLKYTDAHRLATVKAHLTEQEQAELAGVFNRRCFMIAQATPELKVNDDGNIFTALTTYNQSVATLITDDGYALTAAHSVEDDEVIGAFVFENGQLYEGLAIVVWKGDQDLALVRLVGTDSSDWNNPMEAFAWADEQEIQPGLTVALVGRDDAISQDGRSMAAGHVCEVKPGEIQHDAPMRPGDSGGPLTDAAGNLVAINTRGDCVWPVDWVWPVYKGFVFRGYAVRPDHDAVMAIIEADRAKRQVKRTG